MQTQSSSTPSATKQKRRRFPWGIGVLVSIVLIAILIFVAITLLVLSNQGVTEAITTLTLLSIVVGFVVSLLSLLVSFLQWHHPKASPASEELTAASRDHSPPLNMRESLQPDNFLNDTWGKSLEEKTTLPLTGQRSQRFDWGEAPHMDRFYGRDQELATLKQWLMDETCRLVAILGMGGIGKTSLTATLVDQIHEHYDFVFWRSLHNAPPFKRLLQECIQFVSHQQQMDLSEEVEGQISSLIEFFRASRCLFVLDNVESIFQGGSQTGQYLEGYEGYGRLFQRIGESKHRSCLLLTSREKPPEVAFLEGETMATTRSLHLEGLLSAAGRAMLIEKGLQGTEQDWQRLVSHYGGNPLALKLVAQMIREIFGGSIVTFLIHGEVFFRDVRDVLEQQLKRLSAREEEIIYWLAIQREATTHSDLQEHIITPLPKGELQEALRSLRRRHLIEMNVTTFTLQPVILEYLTDRLVDQICEEIRTGQLLLFVQHAVLLAQVKDYIRESQRRLILMPLAQLLLTIYGKEALEWRFQSLLATLCERHDDHSSYTAGNVLNLLIHLGYDLHGYDFSHLVVRQAYLQGIDLLEVNFAYANLETSMFTDIFGSILSVAFSPQGDLVAAGTASNEIRMWYVPSGRPMQAIKGHANEVRCVIFSPDGKLLASGSEDQTVRLWEVSRGRCLSTLLGHSGRVWSVAFSPDGKTLASSSEDQTIRLWEVSSGQYLTSLLGHTNRVWSVAFSPDGRTLVSGGADQTVRLWDMISNRCLAILLGHTKRVRAVAFSPDGKTLASGSEDQTIRLWEVSSGQCLTSLLGHTNRVWSVAFSPDGKLLASSSEDQTIRLWEVSSGQCLTTLLGHTEEIGSVAFNPNGTVLASGGYDQSVRLWEVSSGRCLTSLLGYTHRVESIAFSPDGETLVSGCSDKAVRLWEVSSGRCLSTLFGHTGWVWSVAFSPDGETLVSGCSDKAVRLWEVSSGRCLSTLLGHTGWVWSVAFSPDGTMIASGSEDQTIRLWEVSSGRCLSTLLGHTNWVLSVAFSPDGMIVASGSDDQVVRLWEVSSGQCLYTLVGHTKRVGLVAFSSDGTTVVSGSGEQRVCLWEVSSGRCLSTLLGHDVKVRSMAFSLDGKIFACGSYDGTIELWDRQTATCLHTMRSDRPYERMNITQVKGLTEVQKVTLRSLGAIEDE